jgi:hypothetical protein
MTPRTPGTLPERRLSWEAASTHTPARHHPEDGPDGGKVARSKAARVKEQSPRGCVSKRATRRWLWQRWSPRSDARTRRGPAAQTQAGLPVLSRDRGCTVRKNEKICRSASRTKAWEPGGTSAGTAAIPQSLHAAQAHARRWCRREGTVAAYTSSTTIQTTQGSSKGMRRAAQTALDVTPTSSETLA